MLSRREALLTAGVALLPRTIATARQSAQPPQLASQPNIKVKFDVPPWACDCHTHIFGPPHRFEMSPSRTYTPPQALVTEMQSMHRKLGINRVVIVQPSIYGTDITCLADALRQFRSRARGIAVIDEKTSTAALDGLHRDGVRGIRINLATTGQNDPGVARQRFQTACEWLKSRPDWHIQIFTQLAVIAAMKDQIAKSPVPVVFDHFGGAQAALGVAQPGFSTLLDLLHSGKAYVKISAVYRCSTQSPDYPDAAPLAKALIAANAERVLWGTDWPHPDSMAKPGRKATDLAELFPIDDGRVLNLLADWAPDAATRKTILVENPAKLYKF